MPRQIRIVRDAGIKGSSSTPSEHQTNARLPRTTSAVWKPRGALGTPHRSRPKRGLESWHRRPPTTGDPAEIAEAKEAQEAGAANAAGALGGSGPGHARTRANSLAP